MKSTHSEDLEFLRGIRGCFGSRRIFCVEYEFTGEEIIERRSGRRKNQINIPDIIETDVELGSPSLLILRTSQSQMRIQILPALNNVIMRKTAEMNSNASESEKRHMDQIKQEILSRAKRANLIGVIIFVLVVFGLIFILGWQKNGH